MDISKINKAAKILYNSRINLKRIKKLPEDCVPQTLKEAYDIQEELVNRSQVSLREQNDNWNRDN